MIPIAIQDSRSKVKPILYMLGKGGGISVLQKSIFVETFGIENRNGHSTTQQLWYRLITVNYSGNKHAISVVKPIYGIPTFPLTAKAV